VSTNARLGLLILGAAALAAWLLSAWSPLPGMKAPPAAAGDAVWRAGYPAGHVHLCPPDSILGGPVSGPHPLYARPRRVGHHRTGLIDYGWDWILNPPSDWDFGNQAVS
jgi:hypothetical protein